jgi:hypothetical protein
VRFSYHHQGICIRNYVFSQLNLLFASFIRPNFQYEQLFDLRNDPGEMNDLFNSTNPEHKAKLEDMRKRFLELKMLAHSDMKIVL